MRNALRNFLAWLDRRFPERVTRAELNEVKTRLIKAEAEIQKFNAAMGFGALPKGVGVVPFQR